MGYGWDKVETYTNPRTKEVHEVGRSSGKLRYAVAQVISNSECREKMGTIHESNICAKVKQRKQDYGEGACAVGFFCAIQSFITIIIFFSRLKISLNYN